MTVSSLLGGQFIPYVGEKWQGKWTNTEHIFLSKL